MILHTPPEVADAGLSGLDVDCAVVGLDRRWPLRLADGWRLCQVLHYDLKGWYWVLERDGQVVCLDTIDDPSGLGRDGFPTARFHPGQDLTAPAEVQAAYLTAKRVRKGDLRDAEWARIWPAWPSACAGSWSGSPGRPAWWWSWPGPTGPASRP